MDRYKIPRLKVVPLDHHGHIPLNRNESEFAVVTTKYLRQKQTGLGDPGAVVYPMGAAEYSWSVFEIARQEGFRSSADAAHEALIMGYDHHDLGLTGSWLASIQKLANLVSSSPTDTYRALSYPNILKTLPWPPFTEPSAFASSPVPPSTEGHESSRGFPAEYQSSESHLRNATVILVIALLSQVARSTASSFFPIDSILDVAPCSFTLMAACTIYMSYVNSNSILEVTTPTVVSTPTARLLESFQAPKSIFCSQSQSPEPEPPEGPPPEPFPEPEVKI